MHSDSTDEILRVLCVWRRYVADPEAVAGALQQVWPLLQTIIELFRANSRATERLARCPRYALRTAGAPLETILTSYSSAQNLCGFPCVRST